ncbi:hypothetical protein IFM89_032811 [Coptis chinensis]|uniref:Protein Iojap-related, mitochondrial n=1 Tax=Coptis chinensis TaxID=261450 RepID=A0A835HQW1_9MAGN|nr:hypothetical protein IFM89_032811 [Coptis chinensis]
MLAALRKRGPSLFLPSTTTKKFLVFQQRTISFTADNNNNLEYLNLKEVEKILNDVKADDIKVIPVDHHCDWTDFMVIATGRSTWHVKEKQRGAQRMLLPSVQGREGGKWVVIDAGRVIVHALDEKAREYYNLENLWTRQSSASVSNQENRAKLEVESCVSLYSVEESGNLLLGEDVR